MTTRRRRRGEEGYVALTVALLLSAVLLGAAAFGVDVARWFVEAGRLQNAADSAALAGVVFLPDNLSAATAAARENARLNGFEHGDNAQVTVSFGERRSQLRVTVSADVENHFGRAIGLDSATIRRTSVADYTSPAPMGSPCNTFGNEPLGGTVTKSGPRPTTSVCDPRPRFWAAIEGPATDKVGGDRYSTRPCGPAGTGFKATFECSGGINQEGPDPVSSAKPREGHPEGYFFAVKVGTGLVGKAVRLQIFDPAFYDVRTDCSLVPSVPGTTPNNLNDYTSDAKTRYLPGTTTATQDRPFCTGDTIVRSGQPAPFTSFALRQANDEQDPMTGAGVTDCPPVQFRGYAAVPSIANLTKGNSAYNDAAAKTYRQWVDMCTFYPTRAGNYFLQVRTNVELGGTPEPNGSRDPIIYRGNSKVLAPTGNRTAGDGANSFALRAVATPVDQVAVSGWARMPMLQNDDNNDATFHLLRVPPSAAGQSMKFEFFDAADIRGGGSGTVTVLPPADATGSVRTALPGCQESRNDEEPRPVMNSTCTVTVSNTDNNGQLHHMRIPIPNDYSCDPSVQTNCWFKVRVQLSGSITDFTTWDASLEGDPVRLIE